MAEMEVPSVPKMKNYQEINNINTDVADNGGLIVRYTLYTPAKKNSESQWDDKTYIFDNCEEALDFIRELFQAKIKMQVGELEGC